MRKVRYASFWVPPRISRRVETSQFMPPLATALARRLESQEGLKLTVGVANAGLITLQD